MTVAEAAATITGVGEPLPTYRVFVASPGDVAEERACLPRVVAQVNRVVGDIRGFRVEPVGYETHASPGAGVDAQARINEQIPPDYDIFIGILWSRLGTPTLRDESGTVEEYNLATQRPHSAVSSSCPTTRAGRRTVRAPTRAS